jgi:hypothetical protein
VRFLIPQRVKYLKPSECATGAMFMKEKTGLLWYAGRKANRHRLIDKESHSIQADNWKYYSKERVRLSFAKLKRG